MVNQRKFLENVLRSFLLAAGVFLATTIPTSAQTALTGGPTHVGPSPLPQLNLGGPGSGEFPFLNLVRYAGEEWKHGDLTGVVTPDQLGASGYPLYDPHASGFGGWRSELAMPMQYARTGHYVMTWTGAAKVQLKDEPSYGGGGIGSHGCTGSDTSNAGIARCDNTICNTMREMRGNISGTTLTITTKDRECNLVVGQPISGPGITQSKFGTPTIITGMSGSSDCPRCTGAGGTGTYLVNFSQTVGSSGNPISINPGGRFEVSISGQHVTMSPTGLDDLLDFWILQTGTAGDQANTISNLAFVYTCLNSGNCDGQDDEAIYWTGQIAGTQFKTMIGQSGIGVIRDLGTAQNVFTNVTTWATRAPASYWAFGGNEYRNSIYTGSHGGNPKRGASAVTSFTGELNHTTHILTVTGAANGTITNGMYLDDAHVEGYINDGGPENDGIAGLVLTVTNVIDGAININDNLYVFSGAPISQNANTGVYTRVIGDQNSSSTCGGSACTGTGGTGTYLVSISQDVTRADISRTPYNGSHIINVTTPNVAPGSFIAASGLPSQTQPCGPRTRPACTGTGGEGTYYVISGAKQAADVPAETMTTTTAKYTAAIDSAPPADKETIQVLWPGVAPNPSFSLFSADNGTTFKPLLNEVGNNQVGNDVPLSGHVSTLVYDATFGGWLLFGGSFNPCCGGSEPAFGISNFVPPEVFVELCAELGVNPWITEPWLAADPMTDYMTQYALYIKSNYPNMRPQFEITDETWNPAGTYNGPYIIARTNLYFNEDTAWTPADSGTDWAGKTASTLCQAISQVYDGQTWRYRCIVGVWTAQWRAPANGDARLTSKAYVHQNPRNIPIQSGCAGPGAIQTDCPAPFQQAAAYNWVTEVAVANYWGTSIFYTSQRGVGLAYQYFVGTPSQQNAVMSTALSLMETPYTGTLSFWANSIWSNFYKWAKGCGRVPVSSCGVRGLVAYEGSWTQNGLVSDVTLPITAVTNASPCVINTTTPLRNAYINDGGPPNDGVPGNQLFTSVIGLAGQVINAPGAPYIAGYHNVTNTVQGYQITGPPIYVAPTTLIIGNNGGVADMPVIISGASNSSYVGPYVVGPTVSEIGIPLLLSDGVTPFDCTSLGSIGSGAKLTYVGSANWISYAVANEYLTPLMEPYQKKFYETFYGFGGAGSSQLDLTNRLANTDSWMAMGDDIYGTFSVANCTACSVSAGGTLTLGGATIGTSTASTISGRILTIGGALTGAYPTGATLTGPGLPTGDAVIKIAYKTGATTYALSKTAIISTPQVIDAATSITGRFQVGQTLFGGGEPKGITITASGAGLGYGIGDTFTLSCAPSCPARSNVSINGAWSLAPKKFPLINGMKDFAVQHGG